MRVVRASLLIAVLIAIGVVLCPRTPGPDRIDPQRLLGALLSARRPYSCTATRIYTSRFLGSKIKRTMAERIVSGAAPGRLARLVQRNYTPLVEGEDTIAGRETWVLRLKPRAKYRPWKQLWIDKQTYAILASRDWDCCNRIKRSMTTTRIAYSAVRSGYGVFKNARASGLGRAKLLLSRAPIEGQRLGRSLALPSYVPSGFELVDMKMAGTLRCAQAVYSDGLFSISLFYEFLAGRGREHEGMNRICDWGQGYVVIVPAGRAEVTVLADLPEKELLRVALSLQVSMPGGTEGAEGKPERR